jgi:hypothetical protein
MVYGISGYASDASCIGSMITCLSYTAGYPIKGPLASSAVQVHAIVIGGLKSRGLTKTLKVCSKRFLQWKSQLSPDY